jgi:Mg2+ and Co2+ transporter CorA
MANVSVNQLADAIVDAVREYTEDVTEAIDQKVETIADLVLADVRRDAPKKTGKYAKGFVKTDKSLPGRRRFVIWNKKFYRLVHLLEFGHAKVKGGRVPGKPHLIPAHQRHVDGMLSDIKQIIKNGG